MTVIDVSLRSESRDRYLMYALSVVSGRALPDVRDGLKPVQRRILFAMLNNLKLRPEGYYRKSAAVVGEVLARFHPHGDVACYEAMVRMAQDFSMRYQLVDGQGNFGSLDGDNAAAYRYTEAKLRPLALEVLGEFQEETVPYRENFDNTTVEPEVLPARFPHLLVNGASGIAVGMATNVPPHNLKDVVAALIALQEDPDISVAKLVSLLKGPDFPTGCAILNTKDELNDIYRTGRGTLRLRAEWKIEEASRGKKFCVVTAIPFAINKASLVEKIAELILAKKVPQLVDVRDESTEEVRVVLELAAGADPELAMAYLFKHTTLETGFHVNLTALVPTESVAELKSTATRPELLSLKDCLQHFLDFREIVVRRKLTFERKQLLERVHILEGLVKIFDAIDEAIAIVRKSNGRKDAAEGLKKRFSLSELQAYAVVDMRIYQLSKTNIDDIRRELSEKLARVKTIETLLKSAPKLQDFIRKEFQALSDAYGDKRRSRLVKEVVDIEIREEDFVVTEEVFAIVTRDGWIKRIRQTNDPTTTRLRDGDSILAAHAASTLDRVCFFSNLGFLYDLPVREFPAAGGYGIPIQKLLKFRDGERIMASFLVRASSEKQASLFQDQSLREGANVLLINSAGLGFALTLEELGSVKKSGRRVMKLKEGVELLSVSPLAKLVALFSKNGYALVIQQKEIPVRAQAALGVQLLGLRTGDQFLSCVPLAKHGPLLLEIEGQKPKVVKSDSLAAGRRALKGNKLPVRGAIIRVSEKS